MKKQTQKTPKSSQPKKPSSHARIFFVVNGHHFEAEGEWPEVKAKLDAFWAEVLGPVKKAAGK